MIAGMHRTLLHTRYALLLILVCCPALSAAYTVLLDSLTISSTDPDPTYTTASISVGSRFLLEASGTYSYSGSASTFADAGYLTYDDWATIRTDVGIRATTLPGSYLSDEPGVGAGALLVDLGAEPEVIDWGDYSPTHTYQYEFIATSDVLGFVIGDWWGAWGGGDCEFQACQFDNSGMLSVSVSEAVHVPVLASIWLFFFGFGALGYLGKRKTTANGE